MKEMKHYAAAITGAGRGRRPLAISMATVGYGTAITEWEHGSDNCLNEVCTPKKTIVSSARAAYSTRRASDYGVGAVP